MAVVCSSWFDYEVTLSQQSDKTLGGVAMNLQAAQNMLPGLAGSSPTVTVAGDLLYVESRNVDRPPPAWQQWLLLWLPLLGDWWLTRKWRGAQVRAFELELPGLAKTARQGDVIRFTRIILAGPGMVTRHEIRVEVMQDGQQIASWTDPKLVTVDW